MAKHMIPRSMFAVAFLCGAALGSGCGANASAPRTTGSAGADAGASGAAGTAGAAGSMNTAGTNGSAGANGSAGMTAAAGTAGAAGMTAAAGTTGAAGAGGVGGAPAASTAAGTIVPLYTDPGDSSWTAIVSAQLAHPTVHVVAIVNPDSGPGASRASAYTTGIAKLIAAEIQVIGYVATGYASHSIASMEAAIDQWKAFYPQLEGIFFDEQSDKAADVEYYRTLSQYAKAQGLAYAVGNPGADTAEAFVGVLDTMLIYESKGLPAVSKLAGWHTKYAQTNFGVIPYGAAFDASFVQAARKDVGYIYLQSDDLPNP
jgi:spherulation-specific family 4 protein